MKTYTRDEVYAASLEYFFGDELAANVFLKYCLQNQGKYYELTPDDMHKRLAKEFARIEEKYINPLKEKEIYDKLKGFKKIVCQGSPSFGVGNNFQYVSLSNCLTLPPVIDSYGGILETDQQLVQTSKRRMGVGFDISGIRPSGSTTRNAALTSTGIVPFMERFSNSTREVGQENRRGALLLSLSVHHPDIKKFITVKSDKTKITGANISVMLSDEFMESIQGSKNYELRFPVDSKKPKIQELVDSEQIWDLIVSNSHQHAEPCLLFWDTVKRNTPSDCYEEFQTVGVNACSEINLAEFDACRLMLVNLYSYVLEPFSDKSHFDFDSFCEDVIIAQRLMDDLVDLEIEKCDMIIKKIKSDPEPEDIKRCELKLWHNIKEKAVRGRRTGLGITGLGDAIAACGLKYGSEESISLTEKIYKNLAISSYRSSIILAKERGSFPAFEYNKERNHEFICRIISELPKDLQENYRQHGRRNIANTTTAPAGSISCETQTTSGIEPCIEVKYKRNRKLTESEEQEDFVDELGDRWKTYTIYHKPFKDWMDITGKVDVKNSPYHKASYKDIDWINGVKLQAAAQKWICHAISKTCNLPEDVDEETVAEVIMTAWKLGCKGISLYRENSRQPVVFSEKEEKEKKAEFQHRNAPKRPEVLECDIHHAKVKGEKWVIFVGLMDERPYEVFGGLAENIEMPPEYKKGKIIKASSFKHVANRYDLRVNGFTIKNFVKQFDNTTYQVHTRMVSLGLRHGAKPSFLVEQLLKDPDNDLSSFSKVLSRVLKKYVEDGTQVTSDKVCEQCKTEGLVYQEGCITCKSCGWSRCS